MAVEFTYYQTVDEIAALQVYPEPERDSELSRGVQPDGGSHSSPGYVYFLSETGGTNYFKVGLSGNPGKRRSDLQTGNPRLLRMNFQSVEDMLSVEQRLIQAMSARYQRGDGGTEWFLAIPGGLTQAEELFSDIVRGARD